MKKVLAVLLALAMVFAFAACGSQEKEPEEPAADGVGMANPWTDSDHDGVLEATGFDLNAPAGAANVIYSYMESEGMAQMNYNLDGAMWVYRMQKTDALEDISGVYAEWDYTDNTTVAGMEAVECSYASDPKDSASGEMDCVRVINWYDAQNKVTHSLSALGPDLNGMDMPVYAENLLGGADLYQSFLGLHVSSNDGSEIMVEEGEDGKLNVEVSIFRLCTLEEGVGIYENGTVSFDAKDPNGEPIRCCLYIDSDGSISMEIEDSTWEYLPNGTVITGFDS